MEKEVTGELTTDISTYFVLQVFKAYGWRMNKGIWSMKQNINAAHQFGICNVLWWKVSTEMFFTFVSYISWTKEICIRNLKTH